MDLFWKDQVPIFEVAALHETHPNTILDIYAGIGVHPIYDDRGNVSRSFLRSDIPDAPVEVGRPKRK